MRTDKVSLVDSFVGKTYLPCSVPVTGGRWFTCFTVTIFSLCEGICSLVSLVLSTVLLVTLLLCTGLLSQLWSPCLGMREGG